jgi:hypothetical protein
LANATTNAYGASALGTNVWGGCCTRAIDATYRTTAPYAVLGWEKGAWTFDGSIRADQQVATGSFNQASNNRFKPENSQAINYTKNFTSYSVGGNYQLDEDTGLVRTFQQGRCIQRRPHHVQPRHNAFEWFWRGPYQRS